MLSRRAISCPDSSPRGRALVLVGLLCALTALGWSGPARADVSGPDESIATAVGPLERGLTYGGTFSSPDDIDYLSFEVTSPGETLHFDVINTLTSCNSVDDDQCPMWGTLVDASGNQVGGEGSTAGTGEVDYSSSDTVDWTFSTAGRYYLVLDSSGDLPTFKIDLHDVPDGGGAAGGGAGTGGGAGAHGGGSTGGRGGGAAQTLIASMTVGRHQRGLRPSAVVTLGRPLAWLDAEILAPAGPHHRLQVIAAQRSLRPVAGPERVRVSVPSAWLTRRPHRGALVFRVVAHTPDGRTEVAEREFTLRR